MNISENPIIFREDFQELKKLFPEINLKRVEEVENFHRKLTSILNDECIEDAHRLNKELEQTCVDIEKAEVNLETYDIPSGISKRVLESYAHISKEIDRIENQKNSYTTSDKLKTLSKEYETQYKNQLEDELNDLQLLINNKMAEFNKFIVQDNTSLVLKLKEKSYTFTTPNDIGTATAYKSLIVFDLSILAITTLPVLIHDSPLFKNITDIHIEKILELYQKAGKQVFIALDKLESYTSITQEILQKTKVLELSNKNHELFGRSWGSSSNESTNEENK